MISIKELLFSITKKDFRIDTFRSGGKGGQHQNKTNSGVRITHLDSGATGESREHREQPRNKKAAFKKLVDSKIFQKWHKKKVAEILTDNEMLEKKVDEMMSPKYLKIEGLTGEEE